MVGVPFLLKSRAAMPPPASALSAYSWPNFNCFSQAITCGPSHQLRTSAVTAAPALRKVMYRKSRKADSRSAHSVPADHSSKYWLK